MSSTASPAAATAEPGPVPQVTTDHLAAGVAAGRLAHLPVTAFATILGVAGTAVAWQRAAETVSLPRVGTWLAWLALSGYAMLAVAHLARAGRHPAALLAELRHPVKLAFLPLATVALLLVALALRPEAPDLAAVLWWVGAVGQLALTLAIVTVWTGGRFQAGHVHPGWFIPVVGNLAAPLAGVAYAPAEVSWFFFAVGVAYWLALLPLVLFRLVTAGPLPARLVPTLAILIAPPAVAYLAYLRLGAAVGDPAARVLLGLAVFQAMLLAVRIPELLRAPFAISAWAYTFPLAALASALLVTARETGGVGYRWAGLGVLAAVSLLVAALAARTAVAVGRREICRPE